MRYLANQSELFSQRRCGCPLLSFAEFQQHLPWRACAMIIPVLNCRELFLSRSVSYSAEIKIKKID